MNNDLETLFQTSFRPENTTQAEDWNVPSDRVWGGIEADLKKKKRRKILLFTLLPCAFAAMGLALYFATKQPINHKNITSSAVKNNVESSVNKVVESPSLPMPDKGTAQTNIVTSGQENGKILIAEGRKSAALDIKKQSSQPKNAARNFISSSSVLERSSEGEIKNNSTIQEIATQNGIIATNLVTLLTENPVTTAIAAEDKLSIINETKALLLLAKLETRGFSPIYSQSEQVSQPQNIPTSNFLISTLKSKYASNALIFMAQPFLFKNRISSKDNIDFSGEKVSYAYNVGLGLQRTFPSKKLFWELGIQYSQINYNLDYSVNLPFNANGETQNINGNFDNVYSGAIPTSQGQIQMKMELQRQSGNTVIQGENILITAKGTEKLTFIRIPFSIGAKFATKNRVSFINKISFNQLVNVGSKATFSEILSHHSAIKETMTQVQMSPKPNVWTPEIGVSVGVLTKLNRRFELGGSFFYNKALIPMYKTNTYSNAPINTGFDIYLKYNIFQ